MWVELRLNYFSKTRTVELVGDVNAIISLKLDMQVQVCKLKLCSSYLYCIIKHLSNLYTNFHSWSKYNVKMNAYKWTKKANIGIN